jgi:hypothetical protein
MSERDRNGDGLWIPAHRDLGGISEDGGEVLFDLHLVDHEFRRPDDHRSSASELASARTLLRRFVLHEVATAR